MVLGYIVISNAPVDRRVIRFEVPPPKGMTFNLDPIIPGPGVVSPDGRLLTFSARDAEGKVLLYVRPIDATEARVLEGTDDAFYPFWSPDSRFVGFFTRGRLKKVEAAGSAPLTLCEAPSGRGGSWSADGVIVFAPGSNTPLHRVSDAGGESTPATQLDPNRGDTTHRFPHFLPDGRRFVFLATGGGHAVLVGSLDGGDDKLLLQSTAQAAYASDHLLFLRGRTLMAQPFDAKRVELSGVAIQLVDGLTIDIDANHAVFSASQNGVLAYHAGGSRDRSRLEWFDREGTSLGQLGGRGPVRRGPSVAR